MTCHLAALALGLGLMTALPAAAQWSRYEDVQQYCASGRSGLDYASCMRRMQGNNWQRGYDRPPPPRWGNAPPPPAYRYDAPPYRDSRNLSDMQRRALANCAMLAPRDQPRCRATVMSTR